MYICGSNNCGQLGENSNGQSTWGDGIICPPCKSHLNIPSLLSFSFYFDHSIIVGRNWRAYAIGNNQEGQISPMLPKQTFNKETEIQFQDENGQPFKFISAVSGENYTLYQVQSESPNSKPSLIFITKNHNPIFVDINGRTPISIYGGHTISASIDNEGNIIIMNERILLASNRRALVKSLPSGDKAIQIACCEGLILVLGRSGRVYMSSIANRGENVNFVEVKELEGIQIVSLTGKYQHCLAVCKDGRVFGRGSNSNSRLGMSKNEYVKFTEINTFKKKCKIVEAEAGFGHSLFKTSDGKIFACGSNFYGHLLLKKVSKTVNQPVEALPLVSDPFCIAGYCLSAVMSVKQVPPNLPNMIFGRQKLPVSEGKSDIDEDEVLESKPPNSDDINEAKTDETKNEKTVTINAKVEDEKYRLRKNETHERKHRKSLNFGHKHRRKSTKAITKYKTEEALIKNIDIPVSKTDESPPKSVDTQDDTDEKSPTKSIDTQDDTDEKSPTKSIDTQDDTDEKSPTKSDEIKENKDDDFNFTLSDDIQMEEPPKSPPKSIDDHKEKGKRSPVKINIIRKDQPDHVDDEFPTLPEEIPTLPEEIPSLPEVISFDDSIKSAIKKSPNKFLEIQEEEEDEDEDSPVKSDEIRFDRRLRSPPKIKLEPISPENSPLKLNEKSGIKISKSEAKINEIRSNNSPRSEAKIQSYLAEITKLKEQLEQKDTQISELKKENEQLLSKEKDYKDRIIDLENSLRTHILESKAKEEEQKQKFEKEKHAIKKNRFSPLELFDDNSIQKVRQISYNSTSEVYEVNCNEHYVQKIFHCKSKVEKHLKVFVQECESIIGLNCPNVVKIYGIQTTKFPPSILTELCASNLKKKVKSLSHEDRVKVILGICNGMKEIHKARIIHGGLKLENILLDEDNNAKVSDFGILTFMDKEIDPKTMVFMAPELMLEKSDYDEKIDIYAFGVVLYAILNDGAYPKISENDVCRGKKAPIPQNVSKFSKNLINSCWSFNPADRPSFDEICSMLKGNESNLI
ncbi:hypothetical protein M9Y10_000374 [Tritrichomonas musculus]|uniref:Protein kinase domain-containing protein n=1 Tax=Tritrichomonas musculus TaxID=1915356 RepID=A0ABR2L422_9EUKA